MHSFQERNLEIVSELPDRLCVHDHSAWADRNLAGEKLDAFLEGPVFDTDGNLFVVDIPFGRILELSAAGEWRILTQYDGWPNGMKLIDDRRFLVADHKRGLVQVDRSDGAMQVICEGFRGSPFHGLNDLTLSSNGDVYFTDQGISGLQDANGRVFRLTRNGELELVLSGIPSPNGLVLSADEKTLFLAVTRANAIWRLPLAPDGSTYKVGLFIQMSGGIGPDGLARPQDDDSLLVAHPGLGLWQFASNGLPRVFWQLPGYEAVTNMAVHPTRGDCYITESRRAAIMRLQLAAGGASS